MKTRAQEGATYSGERRSEPRQKPQGYHCVELAVNDFAVPYKFKIWNIASNSMCLLVREDSDILRRIKVGDNIKMEYYLEGTWSPPESRLTAIRHITKKEDGPFKGHYLVGIDILDRNESPPQ